MQRFFIPPDSIVDENFVLRNAETVHQIRKVLRMHEGENILLLDNSGAEFLCEIQEISKKEVSLKILDKRENQSEPEIKINLFQALPKNQNKFEEILKNGVAVGISRFIPIITERCSRDAIHRVSGLKNIPRLEKIIQENAEQSERGILPVLDETQKFAKVFDELPAGLSLIADSFTSEPLLAELLPEIRELPQVNIFVGPEGGFSEKEILLAQKNQVGSFSLGPRILRTETASIAIASTILFS
jgi:16S rRNA (uracil1498-N3)-methyltransferase